MNVIDSAMTVDTPAASAASTSTFVPTVRNSSFSAQADGLRACIIGGMRVARCSATSAPVIARCIASTS